MKNRKKHKEHEKEGRRHSRIRSETKKSVAGILLVGASLILLLARFHKAGPVGDLLYGGLDKLLGLGYYLAPLIFFIVGLLFLVSKEQNFYGIVITGAIFFVLSGLGLIDVLFPDQGGLLGQLAGTLEIPFGHPAAIILLITLLITSLLITLNASITIRKPAFLSRNKKEKYETVDAADLVVTGDEDEDEVRDKKQGVEDEDEDEKEDMDEDEVAAKVSEPAFAPKLRAKPTIHRNYVAPPLDLLKSTSEKPTPGDLRANANIIKRTLESFGIPVEMGEINIGPKVTRYTLKPAEGVKIARITALGSDLALALAAHPIRIEAPIPGKSLVGIEVPNKAASIVRLGGLMAYPELTTNGQLTFALGRDVTGEPIFVDIEKLPHLLVAGATGSGKSILIHSLIIPLLYKNSPEMLKLILIDPKRVELTVYEGIPHLISPVITEGKKTIAVFRWAIAEMERRYEILMKAGSRDIKGYNKDNKADPLSYIVIVIDELADLMVAFGREVEGYIVRLAQMARATGIHLVLSTQRPSVEVVTGLIKANITGRVALQVASQVDSRTILDMAGAEKLLGGGDLLFISNEYSKPKRIQGAYVSEDEIKSVVKFIRDHNEVLGPSEASEESQALANSMKAPAPGVAEAKTGDIFDDYAGDEDDMLDEAIEVVKQAKKASASLLQRRLQVGYARAARLLDIMEAKGLIGPGDGAKPREVFMVDGTINDQQQTTEAEEEAGNETEI